MCKPSSPQRLAVLSTGHPGTHSGAAGMADAPSWRLSRCLDGAFLFDTWCEKKAVRGRIIRLLCAIDYKIGQRLFKTTAAIFIKKRGPVLQKVDIKQTLLRVARFSKLNCRFKWHRGTPLQGFPRLLNHKNTYGTLSLTLSPFKKGERKLLLCAIF